MWVFKWSKGRTLNHLGFIFGAHVVYLVNLSLLKGCEQSFAGVDSTTQIFVKGVEDNHSCFKFC